MMFRTIRLSAACLMVLLLLSCSGAEGRSPVPAERAEVRTVSTATTAPLTGTEFVIRAHRMSTGRAAHTATLLPDGRVLLAGGFGSGEQALASAELYDPKTNTFIVLVPMSVARQSHTATLLPDGKVLLVGGFNDGYLADAEIFDPQTGLFSPTGTMTTARSGHVSILLDSGKVLLTGGVGNGWTFLASSEIYDPATGQFSSSAEMAEPRESHTATRLLDGRVLITGGHQGRRSAVTIYASAEIYDPVRDRFTEAGIMGIVRHKHDATLLADGRVFISGGADARDADGAYRSTEIYDPGQMTFTAGPTMQAARYKHTGTSILLPSGSVLLVGGARLIEVFNPLLESIDPLSNSVGASRFFATATLLFSGEIIFAGGYGTGIAGDSQAWLLQPER
jgi:hypothetical protein